MLKRNWLRRIADVHLIEGLLTLDVRASMRVLHVRRNPMIQPRILCASALLACANLAWGAATCMTSSPNLGTLQPDAPGSTSGVTFGGACTAFGNPDPNDPSAWSFTNYFTFSLASAASAVFGGIDLNFTRTGELFPNSPNRGDPFFMITTDFIAFDRNGVRTYVGQEGPGHNEFARINGFNLEAGDYTMVIQGRVFDTPTNSGWYNGSLHVTYADAPMATLASLSAVAAPVPEPETLALLLMGLPAVAWAARRSKGKRGAATA
jgi:hypothetical protein